MRPRAYGIVFMVGMAVLPGMGGATASEKATSFNMGFSPELFADVNRTDALAAIQVWSDLLVTRWDMNLDAKSVIFDDAATMKTALLAGEMDMVSLQSKEFFDMEDDVVLDHFLFGCIQEEITEEYLLLIRRDSGIENLAALQGKKIALAEGTRMGMGRLWLEILMMKNGFSGIDDFFKSTEANSKSSRAVMGTFFGKTDACLINRRGFETMVELNPQIGKAVTILETSPKLIPAMFCMRASYDVPNKGALLTTLADLHVEPRGQQLLTVFKVDKIVVGKIEDLATARELFEQHALLKSQLIPSETLTLGAVK